MQKTAITIIGVLLTLPLVGCSADDDPVVVREGDGTGQETQWSGDIDGLQGYEQIQGSAEASFVAGSSRFSAAASIRGDTPGAVRPWHVHFGNCASGGGIVGGDTTYPRLMVGADGTASATVVVPGTLDPAADYHVNVHVSDANLQTLIACGNLMLPDDDDPIVVPGPVIPDDDEPVINY